MFDNTGEAISYCAATDNANGETAITTPYGTAAGPFHMAVLNQNIGRFHPFTVFCPVHEKTCTLLGPHPIELQSSSLSSTPCTRPKDIHYTDDCQVSSWHHAGPQLGWGFSSNINCPQLAPAPSRKFPSKASPKYRYHTFRSTNIFLQFDAFVAYWSSSRFKPCKHTLPHPPLSWPSDACDFVFANLLSQPCPNLSCFLIVCPLDIFVIRAGRDWQEEESAGVP